jgi:hypothetical protein
MVQSVQDGERPCFTTVFVQGERLLLVQLEASRLLRAEGLRCYQRYVDSCLAILDEKQVALAKEK